MSMSITNNIIGRIVKDEKIEIKVLDLSLGDCYYLGNRFVETKLLENVCFERSITVITLIIRITLY